MTSSLLLGVLDRVGEQRCSKQAGLAAVVRQEDVAEIQCGQRVAHRLRSPIDTQDRAHGGYSRPFLWTRRFASTIIAPGGLDATMDVGSWLRGLGLEQYEAAFRDSEIDFDVLPELTDQHLKDLGVPLGHRLKLLRAATARLFPLRCRT